MCGTTEHSVRSQEAETTPCGSVPTRSNREAPVVRHNPVTEALVTRRNFVKGSALVVVGVSGFFGGGAITALYKKNGQEQERRKDQSFTETRDEIWERLRESGEIPDPMKVRLAVVALNAAGIEPAKSETDIMREVKEQTRRIRETTFDRFTFETTYHEATEQPDSTGERDGQAVSLYSHEQMMNIAHRHGELGHASMVLLMVNSADTKDEHYLGLAVGDETTPTAIVRSRITGGNVIGHEVGHLLNPYVIGPGMYHEKVITTNLRRENGEPRQVFAFDTIQALIANSTCELEKATGDLTKVNEYASMYSIMGDSRPFSDNKEENTPVFSSAEQVFLNPSLHSTLADGPGQYEISIKRGGNFGVRMKLPENHVLQQLVPGAEELFFGALERERVRSDGVKNPTSIERIGAFVTYDNGRGTVLMDLGLNFTFSAPPPELIGPERHRWSEQAIYADEQLNIVAVVGCDELQPYLRLLQLDTPQGQYFFSKARQVANERNDLIMEKYR